MNWEDLRYILAVSREGTLLAAASSLGVSPTTMSRRLRKLEESQGTALFEKFKHGAVLTGAGERVVVVAESVERLTHELDAEIHGLDTKLGGTIRVTSTEMLTKHFLVDFGAFRALYPGIEIELDSKTSLANMTQREADVAVRIMPVGKAPDPDLAGRKAATLARAVYGFGDCWIGWKRGPQSLHVEGNPEFSALPVRGALGDVAMQRAACAAGMGLARLPCFYAEPLLQRRTEPEPGGEAWVLVHPDLRQNPRLRVFRDAVVAAFKRHQPRLAGLTP